MRLLRLLFFILKVYEYNKRKCNFDNDFLCECLLSKFIKTMKYTELILKVSGRCNLNCDYCYVFNKGDKSYMREPVRMSEELIKPGRNAN